MSTSNLPQYIQNKDPNQYDVEDPAADEFTQEAIAAENEKRQREKMLKYAAIGGVALLAWVVMN